MIAIKVPVAFHTMCHTNGISAKLITPNNSASIAPSDALQPMPRPRGCQMTSVSVSKKIRKAVIIKVSRVRFKSDFGFFGGATRTDRRADISTATVLGQESDQRIHHI